VEKTRHMSVRINAYGQVSCFHYYFVALAVCVRCATYLLAVEGILHNIEKFDSVTE
jgi:hypothetical protein